MPCYEAPPTQKELDNYEKQNNQSKYGIRWTDEQMETEHFCELGRLIYNANLFELCSSHLQKRILEHKKNDEDKGRLWR